MDQVLQSRRGDNSTSTKIVYYGDLNFLGSHEKFRKVLGGESNIISTLPTSYHYNYGSKNPK